MPPNALYLREQLLLSVLLCQKLLGNQPMFQFYLTLGNRAPLSSNHFTKFVYLGSYLALAVNSSLISFNSRINNRKVYHRQGLSEKTHPLRAAF